MTQRALLIGSQTYGLAGCNSDVALMNEVLAARGFDSIRTLVDGAATRAGIVDGIEQLIAAIEPDDAVVLYYSGHGGRVARPDIADRKSAGLTTHFQFIVPFDMDDSEPGDFRGLLSEEVTAFQRRLTEAFRSRSAVPNVTTILDCCHSGYLARAADATQKSVDLTERMFRMRGILDHANQLGQAAAVQAAATNPDAVRLVACQPEQSAFEHPSARGPTHGALTESLASVLEELGSQSASWSLLGDLVRRRVRAVVPEQRPDVEGPAARELFSTRVVPDREILPITMQNDAPIIESAELLGLATGDQLGLQVPGRLQPIGTAVVERIEGGNAVLAITPRAALTEDAVAVRATSTRPKFAIAVDLQGDLAETMRRAIDASSRLRVSGPTDTALAKVVDDGGGLSVVDALGAPWRTKASTRDADGARDIVDLLEALAKGRNLLDLPSAGAGGALDGDVEIAFGVLRDGSVQPLEQHGARLRPGDVVSLAVTSKAATPAFVWVFDVGVSGRATMLTTAQSGALLGPAGSEDDHVSVWGPAGKALYWPDDVPTGSPPGARDASRQETFVIVLADRRGDLSSLATRPGNERGEHDPPGVRGVDALLEAGTAVRDAAAPAIAVSPLRYRTLELTFFLEPP